jgi:N-acetylglucosamine-6-phosphate deacetylase
MAEDLLIFNGKVITETQFLPAGYVLVSEGRIVSLGEKWEDVHAELRMDAQGLVISPGFIDMHTHGIGDMDFMDAGPQTMVEGLRIYAGFGVTRVVGTTLSNSTERIIDQVSRIREAMQDAEFGPMLLGAHIEGPWLAPRCRGGHAREYLRVPEKEDVERLLGEVGNVIRTVTFSPELPNSVWLAEKLSLHGILGAIGHTEASYEEAERVIRAGVRHVTHMYDGTLGYRENPDEALVMMPGMETAVLMNDEVSIELIGCPVHVPTPFFRFIDKVKPPHRKVIVTDSLVGTGKPEDTVLTYRDGRKVYVSQGVLRMIDDDPRVNGNLTGSAVTMNVALRRLQEFARIPLHEAVRWGSINPATTLCIQNETGSIKVGKSADLVIMDEDFNIKLTLLKGRPVYEAS